MGGCRVCKNCGARGESIVTDYETGDIVCTSCDVVQDFEQFQAHIGGINGPAGTYVRVGTTGIGNNYSYRETKIYEAKKVIDDLIYKFGLSETKTNEVNLMVRKITEEEYGNGRWFSVLVGACSYVVMRRDSKVLTMEEVGKSVGCDIFEMGRMVKRVVDFLDLELPEFNLVNSFELAITNSPSLTEVSEDTISRMLKQGTFLVQCLINWSVTTGRRPMPIVAAVLVFVSELNQTPIKIDDVANELDVVLHTCKLRYKELLERLVKVAKTALPWGKDVNMKNIMTNAPSVIQYLELKSMSNHNKDGNHSKCGDVYDFNNLLNDCLSEEKFYGYDDIAPEKDSRYFQPGNVEIQETSLLSSESLSIIHSELKNAVSSELKNMVSVAMVGQHASGGKRAREYGILTLRDWWKGESELSRKLHLEKILEKNLGLDATPPSFDKGCLVYERRNEKIKAAKLRIRRTMYGTSRADDQNDVSDLVIGKKGKKRKREMGSDLDWEDFIIETLLLHKVREEEIETGHYKALLGLHVFNGAS
ncbi:unnamed protein product [Cuscuta epithymum]|uniref:TFIIB-type domain-containing protein n=1 Tax=Cuscuta epithymum TaxID=186058 RepID=A0AAV0F6Q4_9ASTE|nr:unnamed protein product [Cuscuta epithymum]